MGKAVKDLTPAEKQEARLEKWHAGEG